MLGNIFISRYEGENAWTEALMKFLKNSNTKVLNSFFALLNIGIKIRKLDEVIFKMQEKEEKSVPDATISSLDDRFVIYFEVKTREDFDKTQAENHLRALEKREEKVRALVIVTKSPNEPIEFSKFTKRYTNSPIKIKFLSWTQIRDFLSGLSQEKMDSRVKFLVKHYQDFLENEVSPKLKWSGFPRDICQQWESSYRLREEIRKLITYEVGPHIERKIKNFWPNAKPYPVIEKREMFSISWGLLGKQKSWIRIEAGFWGGKDWFSSPIIYVLLVWRLDITEKREKAPKFLRAKKRLENQGFKFFLESKPPWLEKVIEVKEFAHLPVSAQLRKIFDFIDTTIETLHKSGIVEILKK